MNNRQEYIQEMNEQLDQWRSRLHELEENANRKTADARREYDQKIKTVEEKMQNAEKKLTALQQSTDESWDRLKEDVTTVWKDLNEAFADAVSKLD